MIIVDTNVLSETMRPSPEPSVIQWLDDQETTVLFVTTTTISEIGFALRVLPAGKRRRSLEARFEKFLEVGFVGRILSFDVPAARLFGDVMGSRRELGRPMGLADGQIAAIARVHRFAVATRNVRDFEDCGIEVLNPFSA